MGIHRLKNNAIEQTQSEQQVLPLSGPSKRVILSTKESTAIPKDWRTTQLNRPNRSNQCAVLSGSSKRSYS